MICLLVTPILYIATLSSCEKYLNKRYSLQIQDILIGDSTPLMDGSVRVEEQVAKNIHAFLKQDWIIQKTRFDLNILVTTMHGKIIYPVFLDINSNVQDLNAEFNTDAIAKNNFNILNNGLNVKIEANLSHGSFIGNSILIVYFGVSFVIFFVFYKIGSSKAAIDRKKNNQLIADLKKEEKNYKQILDDLKKERQGLFENIKALNAKYQEDKRKAKINEEEMFEEIVSLEEKFNTFLELKQSKEKEIEELKSKIQLYERRKTPKGRRNEFDFITKRFSVLYKNLEMNRKALLGFLNLSEEHQIKVEELIHLLDLDPDKITIKRKVFSGKKNRTTCYEVLFAYNGRLYYKKNENNKIEILVIGTKNTQGKDMEFIHNL